MSREEKFGKKSPTASGRLKMGSTKKANLSHRNPLKDLNSINSSSSSSIEVPRGGCLSFFLSNSSSKTLLYNKPKSLPKTPKSAPNPRPSKPRSKPLPKNPEKPTSQNPLKAKKTTPSLNQWQNGKNPSFRAPPHPKPSSILEEKENNVDGCSVKKLGSGSCLKDPLQQQKHQQWPITRMMTIDDTGKPPEPRLIDFQKADLENNENGTPLNKVELRPLLDSTPGKEAMEDNLITTTTTTTITTTPPIQVSLSPEIQCGSSLASATPACFGAGHVLSGVTDKRKCRPRGILTVGEDLGFCKARVSDASVVVDDNVIGFLNNSRVSLVPAPAEASMHWLLSPSPSPSPYEEDKGSPQNVSPVGPTPFHSPSSGHGVSSHIYANSNTTGTSETPEFEGFVGTTLTPSAFKNKPFHDHLVSSSSSSSPAAAVASSCYEALMSKEDRGYRYKLATENSPISEYSLGSQNVIFTPQSDSSSDRNVRLSWLKYVEDHQKCQFELDTRSLSSKKQTSMSDPADVLPLPGFSFQFMYSATPSNSVDQTQFQNIFNDRFESLSQSEMNISWREGLVSRIFEMDELDCCRWKSDEEEDGGISGNYHFKSDFSFELDQNTENDQPLTDDFASLGFVSEEPELEDESKIKSPPQRPSSCAESISTEGGGLVASGDSDWTLCYKNQLFKI